MMHRNVDSAGTMANPSTTFTSTIFTSTPPKHPFSIIRMLTRAGARKRQAPEADENSASAIALNQDSHPQDKKPTATNVTQIPAAKRRKVRNTDNLQKRSGKRVTKTKGTSKGMLDIPLDIVFEIIQELKPHDLLALSRTTKDFHNLLVRKSSIHFWRKAFENAPELPPRFAGMNELAFTNLLFSFHCHNCLKPNVRRVIWEFQARYCPKCEDERLLRYESHACLMSLGFLDVPKEYAHDYLPTISIQSKNRDIERKYYFTDKKWIEELKETWKGLGKSDKATVDRMFKDRREFIKNNKMVAIACSKWYNHQRSDREDELNRFREDRLAAIRDRLRNMGYAVEIDKYPEQTNQSLKEENLVREPKPLTDRAWAKIEAVVLGQIDDVRAWRIEKEYKDALRPRIEMAKTLVTKVRMLIYGDVKFPAPLDFLSIPQIRSLIDVPPEANLTSDELLDSINLVLPEILSRWQESVTTHLARLVVEKATCMIPGGVDPLSLAIGQIFLCDLCGEIRIYPNIQSHCCWDEDNAPQREDLMDRYGKVLHSVFSRSPGRLHLKKIISVADVVGEVVRATGHAANQATLEDMEQVKKLLICITCENRKHGIRPTMDWKTMIFHGIMEHSRLFSVRSATDAEAELIAMLNHVQRYRDNDEHRTTYLCAHCDDVSDLTKYDTIRFHLLDKHQVFTVLRHDVIESSDTIGLITEVPPYRRLISDQVVNEPGRRHEVNSALRDGYGVVCDFDKLAKNYRTPDTAGTSTSV
ncbi:hypothetical protein ABKN59_009975 [Abortiporus biennis]